jgi:hypothetical protein
LLGFVVFLHHCSFLTVIFQFYLFDIPIRFTLFVAICLVSLSLYYYNVAGSPPAKPKDEGEQQRHGLLEPERNNDVVIALDSSTSSSSSTSASEANLKREIELREILSRREEA